MSSGASIARGSRSSSTVLPPSTVRRRGAKPAARSCLFGDVQVARPDFETLVAVAFERVAVQLLNEPSTMHDADTGGQAVDLGEDMARHEHGHSTLMRQRAQQLADLDHAGGIEAIRGFVEYQELRFVEQGARQRQSLQVTERQNTGTTVGIRTQAQLLDRAVDDGRVGDSLQAPGHVEVLAHGELRIGDRRVDEMANATPEPGGLRSNTFAEQLDVPVRGRDHAQQHPDGG